AVAHLGGQQTLHPFPIRKTRRARPGDLALHVVLAASRRQGVRAGDPARDAARLAAGRLEVVHALLRSNHSDLAARLAARVVAARARHFSEARPGRYLHDRDVFDVADRAQHRARRALHPAGLFERGARAATLALEDLVPCAAACSVALHVHRFSTESRYRLVGDRGRRDADRGAGCRWLSVAGIQRADLRAHHSLHHHDWRGRFCSRSSHGARRAEVQGRMTAFVELCGVSKGFDSASGRVNVLENVNLEVAQGEFVAIVGYSGSGKTTLVSLLAGLLMPDSGSVNVAGKLVRGPGPDRGVVFQNYSLLPWLTVFENIHLAVEQVFSGESDAQRRARTERYVKLVNLTHAKDRKPGQLSGGMRQRVSVARALAMDPAVLLLDEPLGALDALTRGTLQTEIERIWQADRKTVVMITNDVDEAILLADRIIPLSAGPNATLGPAIALEIERPRDRKALNHHPDFKRVRTRVIEYLLGSSAQRRAAQAPRQIPIALAEPLEGT